MTNMEPGESERRHQLFLVRMWSENLGDGKTEWRGQIQSAAGGEPRYFRDMQMLIAHLNSMLPSLEPPCTDASME